MDLGDAELELVAIGADLSEDLNVAFAARVGFAPGGQIEQILGRAEVVRELTATISSGRLLAAAAMPWNSSWIPHAKSGAVEMLRVWPDLFGLEHPDATAEGRLGESVAAFLTGVRGVRGWMRPGAPDQPLLSNFFAELDVDDATAYLASYEQSVRIWSEVLQDAETDFPTSYRLERQQLGGQPAIRQVFDYSAGIANEPAGVKAMMEQLFGADGEMISYITIVDDHRVLIGYATAAVVESVLNQLRADAEASRPSDDEGIQRVVAPLTEPAHLRLLISPTGCIEWLQRWTTVFGDPLLPNANEIPEMPPLALAIRYRAEPSGIDASLIVPGGSLKGLAKLLNGP